MGKVTILFTCMIFAAKFCAAQTAIPKLTGLHVFDTSVKSSLRILPSPAMMIKPAFSIQNLAFFCRQEIKFEKATGIPFKFRLGSVQYVDYLEGKHSAGILVR
jgi:hypothetical protein